MSEQPVEPPDGKAPFDSPTDAPASPPGPLPAIAHREGPRVDALSAMTPRFNFPFRWFARRFFRHFDLDDATVERLRELESRGPVVYVMRYASRLDYFLFNTLFLREGLRSRASPTASASTTTARSGRRSDSPGSGAASGCASPAPSSRRRSCVR